MPLPEPSKQRMGLGVSMSDLQKAAQMALEQLRINRTNFRKGPSKSICKMLAGGNDDVILALEAALTQPDEAFCDTYCTWSNHHPDCEFREVTDEP